MIDVMQVVLVMVATTVTALTVLLGVQVFHILKEVRESIKKFNKIIDEAAGLVDSVAGPINSLTDLFSGASSLSGVAGWLWDRISGSKEADEED